MSKNFAVCLDDGKVLNAFSCRDCEGAIFLAAGDTVVYVGNKAIDVRFKHEDQ